MQAEKGTQDFLKTTIKYYATSADKAETVTVAWDGIMSQVKSLIIAFGAFSGAINAS